MRRQIPKRPTITQPILVGTGAMLLQMLPEPLRLGLERLFPASPALQTLSTTAGWLLPLLSVCGIALYAVYLQWIDRRRYELIFDEMVEDRQKFHFQPLPDIVIQDLSPVFQKVALYGRNCGSYILDFDDVNLSIGESIGASIQAGRSNDERFVKVHGTKYLVHPELIK